MKRPLLTVAIIVSLVTAGILLYKQSRINNAPLKKAQQAELAGNVQTAYDLYTEALVDICPSLKLPDANKSKVVDASTWRNDLSKYVEWICYPAPLPKEFTEITGFIDKYKDSCTRSENRIVNITTQNLELAPFISQWKNSFYAQTATFDSSHMILASGSHFRNISFLNLSAEKGFTYKINLINISTGRQTKFTLFSEGSVCVLAYPGKYLLVCKSSVNFSSGEIWQSPNTIVPLTIPEKSSIVRGTLITKVAREK
jgi:hypothetical protein